MPEYIGLAHLPWQRIVATLVQMLDGGLVKCPAGVGQTASERGTDCLYGKGCYSIATGCEPTSSKCLSRLLQFFMDFTVASTFPLL